MDYASTITTTDTREHLCDCCGASLRVSIPRQTGHNDREEYNCPECLKEFRCRASLTPKVVVLSPRTDGLTGICVEKYILDE